MDKKKQKCKVKTKVVNTYNYCGEDLICTGIEKGDSLAQVIKKLNDSICKETPTYTFEDTTTECETKGFNVYENEELIYTFCQECCGNDSGYEYINSFYWQIGDVQIVDHQATNYTLIDSFLPVTGTCPTINITKTGKYKITVEDSFGNEDPQTKLYTGIGVNGLQPVISGSVFYEQAGATTRRHVIDEYSIYTSIYILDLVVGDMVDFYMKMIIGTVNLEGAHRIIIEKIA